MQKVRKTVLVNKVSPGPYGGAMIIGVTVEERAELRCKLSYRIVTRIPTRGEFWVVEGGIVDHPQNGPQLLATNGRPTDLPHPSFVSHLLEKHPGFRGFAFRHKKIAAVVRKFGEEGLVEHLVDGRVYKLAEVLKLAVATGLVDAWQALRKDNATFNFLMDHKFSPELARKVKYLCQQGNAVDRLNKNPYAMVCLGEISRNIWRTVENCAKKLGFSLDFEGRLAGGIEHVLHEHLRSGHTVIGKDDLLNRAEQVLGTRRRAEEGLRLALEQKFLCVYPLRHEMLFQLTAVGIMEQALERRIVALVSRKLSLFDRHESRIRSLVEAYDARVVAAAGHRMNVEQKNAVVMALTNPCSIVAGHGGTGQTTVMKVVGDIAKLIGRGIYILAFAEKAKERLRQVTGHKSFTIHAFINALKKGADDICLDNDPLIVIDECSMVGTALFNNLLSLLEVKQYSLLTVGDTEQTSPVGFGLVWHRMVRLDFIPRTNLTQVFRQTSSLHDLDVKVRSKDKKVLEGIAKVIPDWNGETEGVFFVSLYKDTLRDTLFDLKSQVDRLLRQGVRAKFQSDLQGKSIHNPLMAVSLEARMKAAEDAGEIPKAVILMPHVSRRMPDSADKINRHLQGCLTPLANSLYLCDRRLRVGDPVIVMGNAYDLEMFNGTTGTLLAVTARNGKPSGLFRMDDRKEPVWLSVDELLDVNMQLAYALSIHKSQGSEYDAVLVCAAANSLMFERSFIYTALTRSKKLCLIVGSREVFRKAVMSPSRAETLEVAFFLSRMN